MHSQNKIRLTELYLDKVSKIENEINDTTTYKYKDLKFYFSGINYKYPEKMIFHISIPQKLLGLKTKSLNNISIEHYLLKYLGKVINDFNIDNLNKHKDIRERPYIEAQETNEVIISRNGIKFDKCNNSFILNLFFQFPLINNHSIIAKTTFTI